MKKEIYKLFTIENGIRMNKQTLEHINTHINSQDDLNMLLAEFTSKFNTAEVTIDDIDQILSHKCESKPFYKIHNFRYNQKNLSEKYEYFKRFVDVNATPISLLDDFKESYIFGIIYKNRLGVFVIEDEHEEICLDFSNLLSDRVDDKMISGDRENNVCSNNNSEKDEYVKNNLYMSEAENNNQNNIEPVLININEDTSDVHLINNLDYQSIINNNLSEPVENKVNNLEGAFIFENMFLSLKGYKENGNFIVKKIIRPKIKPYKSNNTFLAKENIKILILGRGYLESHKIEELCVLNHPKILLIPYSCDFVSNSCDIIRYPSGSGHLPQKGKDCTNPFVLETHDKKISFINSDIFKYKESGMFFGNKPLEAFIMALLSQQSLNPFDKVDLYSQHISNYFVISQNFCSFILDAEGVVVVSVPPIAEGSYCCIDLANNKVEILQIV